MVTYALDASAILRYLDGEAGAARVKQIIKEHLAGKCRVAVSAIHWGEVGDCLQTAWQEWDGCCAVTSVGVWV